MKASVADRIKQRLGEFTAALEEGQSIRGSFACRRIKLNLKPKVYDAEMVKGTRILLGVSQSVFAMLLGTSVKTIQSWEQGKSPPKKIACRFMDEIRLKPDYWRSRLQEAVENK